MACETVLVVAYVALELTEGMAGWTERLLSAVESAVEFYYYFSSCRKFGKIDRQNMQAV
jgi:hypothetical protein